MVQPQVATKLSTADKEHLPPFLLLLEQEFRIMSNRNLLLTMSSMPLPPMDREGLINAVLYHTIIISLDFQWL